MSDPTPNAPATPSSPPARSKRKKRDRGRGWIYQRRGSRYWWCGYYNRGTRIRESTEQLTEADAKKYLDDRLDEIAVERKGGQRFIGPAERRVRVTDLLDALEADAALRGVKAIVQAKAHLAHLRTYFARIPAVTVTAEMVDRYITTRLESKTRRRSLVAPATVNGETQLLGQAFRLALERGRITRIPPIRHLPERNTREGFFEAGELDRVVAALPAYLKDVVRFASLSGWRRGEIATLTWADVDREAHVIRLRAEHSKNGSGRVLAMDGVLAEILQRRWKDRTVTRKDGVVHAADHVFHRDGIPVGDFRKAWTSACETAGVSGRLFHDLRRTAVRAMVRAGVPERVAMAISGHRTRSMFDRYNIVNERDLREAMQRTSEYVENLPVERSKIVPIREGASS